MTVLFAYDRLNAVSYARRWAFKRNPKFANFDKMGGDCTNFASQVLYAGRCPMNYSKYGWYYRSLNDRAPAWTSVNYLYKFLINNEGRGPVAKEVSLKDVQIGDLVQLDFDGDGFFNHTPIIVDIGFPKTLYNIFIAAHTIDRLDYRLSNYNFKKIRFLHILGYRK
ncbi:Putative amidase domain-containing protein [Caminicella sporogenes DSM 14501]|uniref:Putative amidase domain-containing protein n=1 Tax=Caminicella sporogenes DSM 14501 TaxID=1121266 RepID=A0A1M6R2G7_9FIRM|nr:amidase domain-containing protein [Caminicella sporogenes]RKD27286.1 amidase [Caminicella sporogenes]WIF94282.1 amidase domain-containing protein [Caminicella sporogenes]SHK26537.1 Putative amidase domain-containing protein [Caminicella sporogenes DSM 14501]